MVAAEAAYRDGDPWRQALLAYLRGNRERVLEAVAAMPGLSATRPEATYLAWIDCREMMAARDAITSCTPPMPRRCATAT